MLPLLLRRPHARRLPVLLPSLLSFRQRYARTRLPQCGVDLLI